MVNIFYPCSMLSFVIWTAIPDKHNVLIPTPLLFSRRLRMTTPKHVSRICTLLIIMALPCSLAMVAAPSETSLVQASCSRCHSLNRVCKKLGQSQKAWEKTITRMQSKGAGITDSQITPVAAFLSQNDTTTSGLCK